MDRLARTVFHNSVAGMAAQLAIKVLSFGFSVLVVRSLGAETYGQYAAVLAFGALFVFVADLGLSPYAVREVARQRAAAQGAAEVDALYGDLLALRLLLAVLAAGLMIGAAWLTGRPPVMVAAIALGALGLIIYAAQGAGEAVLGGLERLDLAALAKTANQVAIVIVGALALALGLGYYGLILATLLGATLMAVLTLHTLARLGPRPRGLRPAGWLPLLRASLPFGVIAFTLGLSYKFDSVLLNIFRGDAETGYYSAAYNLVFTAVVVSNALNTALYPSLTRQAQQVPGAIEAVGQPFLRYLLLLSAPIAVGAWLTADQLIALLYSSAYAPAAGALRILSWVVPLMYMSEFLGYLVVIQGQESRVARSIAISTGVNVALNLLLIPWFGFTGAALMTVLTEAVLVGQYLWLLRALLRRFDWRWLLLRPALAVAALAVAVIALHGLPLPVIIAIGGLVYGGALLALGVIGQDEVGFVRGLVQFGQPKAGKV
jgi:O-antigen/teichoic acid export membrane protein